jgi:hypothetical protein
MAKTTRPKPTPKHDEPEEKDSPVTSRLAIPLDKDGKILLGNMRDTNRGKLAELMRDAELRAALGVHPVHSGEQVSEAVKMALPPELMMPVVAGLSALDTVIIARVTGAPYELVARYGPYSRDEREQIAPLLASVLAKHAGGLFTKWGEESALLLTLVSISGAKIAAIRAELEKRGPASVHPFAGQVVRPAQPGDVQPDTPDEPTPGGES